MPLAAKSLRAFKKNPDDPRHGTKTGYNYGCRCDACFAANKKARMDEGARKAAAASGEPFDFSAYVDRIASAKPEEVEALAKSLREDFVKSELAVPHYREILMEIEESNSFEHDVSNETEECVLSLITHAVNMDGVYQSYLVATIESGYMASWLERLCEIYCD